MASHPMSPHDHAIELLRRLPDFLDLNEADTRHQIIDVVLHEILCWPRSSVSCESYINPGYADYVLLGRRERNIIFVEAKKTGVFFQLPVTLNDGNRSQFISIKTLLTDPAISKAVCQVREYCLNVGCEYAAITNGLQWVFFKTFARDEDWRQLQAFVIKGLEYFDSDFIDATNKLSYSAITSRASLVELFGDLRTDHRPRYFPKESIVAYDHEVTSNHLAPSMRPLIERYFGRMNTSDSDFVEKCYVNSRAYRSSEINVKQLIDDSLSPYFRNYNVKDFFVVAVSKPS